MAHIDWGLVNRMAQRARGEVVTAPPADDPDDRPVTMEMVAQSRAEARVAAYFTPTDPAADCEAAATAIHRAKNGGSFGAAPTPGLVITHDPDDVKTPEELAAGIPRSQYR